MKRIIIFSILIALLGPSSSAYAAKFLFGTQDSIHFVAKTSIPGPGESRLFLGHLVTMKSFLLPYHIESRGYVLGISGDKEKYVPLPKGSELEALQTKGELSSLLRTHQLS